MAPFGATTSGICMVFRYALVFFTLDPFFGAPDPTSWPWEARGPLLGPKSGAEKCDFVEGLVPHEVSRDFLRGEWFLPYPGTLWVWPFPPKPSQGGVLQGFPPNPKIPGAPLGPWVGCLLSLCGPLAYCRGRWHGRRPFIIIYSTVWHRACRPSVKRALVASSSYERPRAHWAQGAQGLKRPKGPPRHAKHARHAWHSWHARHAWARPLWRLPLWGLPIHPDWMPKGS